MDTTLSGSSLMASDPVEKIAKAPTANVSTSIIDCDLILSSSKLEEDQREVTQHHIQTMSAAHVISSQSVYVITTLDSINVFQLQPLFESVIPLRGAVRPDRIRS